MDEAPAPGLGLSTLRSVATEEGRLSWRFLEQMHHQQRSLCFALKAVEDYRSPKRFVQHEASRP